MIPKATSPLTKFVRTGEGFLIFASNIALVVLPIVSTALTASQAVKFGVILNGAALVARTVLKIVAALATVQVPSELGIESPFVSTLPQESSASTLPTQKATT